MPGTPSITTVGDTGTIPDITFTAAQLGQKEITETVPAGWSLTLIGCTGDTTGLVIGRYDTSSPLAFVNGGTDGYDRRHDDPRHVDAGESVVCTFTNTEHASLDLVKERSAVTALRLRRHRHNMPGTPSITTVGDTGTIPDITFTAAQLGQGDHRDGARRLVADPHRLHRRHDRPGHRPLRPAARSPSSTAGPTATTGDTTIRVTSMPASRSLHLHQHQARQPRPDQGHGRR